MIDCFCDNCSLQAADWRLFVLLEPFQWIELWVAMIMYSIVKLVTVHVFLPWGMKLFLICTKINGIYTEATCTILQNTLCSNTHHWAFYLFLPLPLQIEKRATTPHHHIGWVSKHYTDLISERISSSLSKHLNLNKELSVNWWRSSLRHRPVADDCCRMSLSSTTSQHHRSWWLCSGRHIPVLK